MSATVKQLRKYADTEEAKFAHLTIAVLLATKCPGQALKVRVCADCVAFLRALVPVFRL